MSVPETSHLNVTICSSFIYFGQHLYIQAEHTGRPTKFNSKADHSSFWEEPQEVSKRSAGSVNVHKSILVFNVHL